MCTVYALLFVSTITAQANLRCRCNKLALQVITLWHRKTLEKDYDGGLGNQRRLGSVAITQYASSQVTRGESKM